MIALEAVARAVPPVAGEDDAAWDALVAGVPGGDLVQTVGWAASKRALGFTVATARLIESGRLVGGGQIVVRRFGPLGAVGYVARGPLLVPGCEDRAAAVLAAVEAAAREERVRHLIVQPPLGDVAIGRALAARGYAEGALEVAPTATVRVDLGQDLERILARMSTSQRSHIRRSERAGVTVRLGDDGDVERFAELHAATARRQGFAPLSLDYLRLQWRVLHPSGQVQIFLAYHQERLLAGIWVSAFGDTVTYRLPGWSGSDAKLYPSAACLWAALRWAKAQGHRWFDFGGLERRHAEALVAGTTPPAGVEASPDAMKLRFGGDPILLPVAWHKTFVPLLWPIVRGVYPRLARTRLWERVTHGMRGG